MARPGIDWNALGDETVELLRRYLAIDTTNPPGNEILGVRFLSEVLAREDIESEIAESAPGRGNLVARLKGDGSLGGIVLHHHIDVVYADRRYWTVDPFGGVRGHGSQRWPDTAPHRLVRALGRLLAAERPPRVLPEIAEYFRQLARVLPPGEAAGFDNVAAALREPAFRARFLSHRQHAALVRTTFAVNIPKASRKINVIPPQAVAQLA